MRHAFTVAARILVSVAILLGSADAAEKAGTYTLLGFNLSGIKGVDQKALEAKLKHKPGDRITRDDIKDDTAIIEKELKAKGIQGRLFATMAERNGRVWIIVDVLDNPARVFATQRQLEALRFEGASRVPADALARASGLRPGDLITPQKLDAARKGIVAAYAKAIPGKTVQITGKMQAKDNGKVVMTWIVREPS